MLTLSGMIVANVGTDYINTYLKSKKYAKEDEGKAVEYWVNDLIARERLDIDDFENFLFDELSFGKRKSIRVYKIDNDLFATSPNLEYVYEIAEISEFSKEEC